MIQTHQIQVKSTPETAYFVPVEAHGYTDDDWCVIGEDQLLGDWDLCPDLDEPTFELACEPAPELACERTIAVAPMRPGGYWLTGPA
jgi:hypothetical protein